MPRHWLDVPIFTQIWKCLPRPFHSKNKRFKFATRYKIVQIWCWSKISICLVSFGGGSSLRDHSQFSLDRWYKEEAKEESVCGEDTRFRFCANCDKLIDRLPLVARDTDFTVCGNCHNVPYCSDECHDVYWLTHAPQCGKPVVRKKFVNYKAKDRCNHCLCAGATLQCINCKAVRYCDAECQKADWKEHKQKCCKKLSDNKK